MLSSVVLKPPAVNTASFSSYPQPCQAFCSRAVSVAIEGRLCGDGCPGEGSGARHGLCALFQFISMWIHHCRRVSLKQRAPCSAALVREGPPTGTTALKAFMTRWPLPLGSVCHVLLNLACLVIMQCSEEHFLLLRGCSFISWETSQTSFNFKYQQIDWILIIF